MKRALAIAVLAALPAFAQEVVDPALDPVDPNAVDPAGLGRAVPRERDLSTVIEDATGPKMTSAPAGTLRLLDKVTGQISDLDLSLGQTETVGRLTVMLDDCRFPTDNPASDAQAHLTVVDNLLGGTVFSGWMLASSPALSAMDHARYDIWVLSCESGFVAPEMVPQPEGEGGGEEAPPEEEINEG